MTHYIVVSENEIVKAEMERPETHPTLSERFRNAGEWDKYNKHIASLPRIHIHGKHNWKVWQEVEEGRDVEFDLIDNGGWQGQWVAIPIEQTMSACNHDALVDTGIGYYHCPACNEGWTYEEWRSKQPTPEGEKVEDYYPGYQYQRLFNAIHSTGGTALQGEMDEIIRIVHKDFPLTNDNTHEKI